MRRTLPKSKYRFLALGFLIPFIGMLMVMLISRYKPFGGHSMLYSDCYHQYYPFFLMFSRTLKRGQSLIYNWNLGMGMDYLGLIAYYLGSPLNLLSVLVPEKWMVSFFSLLTPIRLGFAGLFFACFLREVTGRDDFSISLFGGFYGVCAWALGFQWNVMWLDTFALTPLVILGEYRLLKDGKFLLYTLSLWLAVLANYYIGLFVCIFVALVFFCYEICTAPGWKRFAIDLGRMAVFSALAIGMTLILTLPTVAALQTTQSAVNKFPEGFRLNIAKSNTFIGLLGAMRRVAGNMGGAIEPNFKEGLPNLYCGVGSILFAVLFLLSPDIKKREKLCTVFLLLFFNVSFIIRQLDYIWHGFHFTNMIPYRFSYLYSFVVLYMAYRGFCRRLSFDGYQICAAGFLTGALLTCSDALSQTEAVMIFGAEIPVPVFFLYNFIFLLLYVGALLYGLRKVTPAEDADEEEYAQVQWLNCIFRKHSYIMFAAVCVLEIAATLTAFGLYFPGTSVAGYPRGGQDSASAFAYLGEREKYSLFVRTEVTHAQTLNDSALNDYSGISTFTSSANVRITEFLKALGYGAKNTYNRYCFEESSPVANLLLNLKYMVDRQGRDRESAVFAELHHFGNARIYENNAYLPLGFLAEPELALVDFDEKNPFTLQNTLFCAATGLDPNVFTAVPEEAIYVTGENVDVFYSRNGAASYENAEDNAAITYHFTADRDGFACIHVDVSKNNHIWIYLNGNELYKEDMSLPQMLAVGDVLQGDKIEVRVSVAKGEKSVATVKMQIMDEELFFQGYEILSASTLKLTDFSETYVRGTIDCNRKGLLYTSIPQNGNWVAFVDGKETEISLVGECMVGIALTEGTHMVEFFYRNRAVQIGGAISCVCLLALFGIWVLTKRPQWLPRRKK